MAGKMFLEFSSRAQIGVCHSEGQQQECWAAAAAGGGGRLGCCTPLHVCGHACGPEPPPMEEEEEEDSGGGV